MSLRILLVTVGVLLELTVSVRAHKPDPVDARLHDYLKSHGITRLDPGPRHSPVKVQLGRLLYFDKVLSGNRDTACATCHHPSLFTDDGLCLSIGTGGTGLGPQRIKGSSRPFVARNATDVFNRGSREWTTMFWDTRVAQVPGGSFATPAHAQLPSGLESVLAAQAMFPVTGHDEMRGFFGDPGNEIAVLPDSDFQGIWSAVMNRILSIPAYRRLFARAYPGVPQSKLGFQHAANAIAAFESQAFTRLDSPWDRYLAGDLQALDRSAKRGAVIFYGSAGCARCHSGNLLTDQKAHNLAIPQLGPGKPPSTPLDFGLENVTNNAADRFRFRTPPLRNVEATGPWMHNGAYTTLQGAVSHHLNPVSALMSFDLSQLPGNMSTTVRTDPITVHGLIEDLDPLVSQPLELSSREFSDVMSFLRSLTSPSLHQLNQVIPDRVPSGLPVDRLD